MASTLQRYFIPGLVIRSVLIGATYSTGREVTEFFLRHGVFSAFVGILITTAIYSVACIVAFELAFRYQVLDYKSFSRVYMGRWWFLYEVGFVFGVMLTLSAIAAATGQFGAELFGSTLTASVVAMLAIAGLVSLGSARLEKIMSVWSVLFYGAYGVMLLFCFIHFGPEIGARLKVGPIGLDTVKSAVIYACFNCTILPVMIFVARHFHSSRDARIAGAFTGPLVILPGLAIILMLIPFTPGVVNAPVPIVLVLDALALPWLALIIKIAIVGELALNGAGLLHGVNERVAKALADRHLTAPRMWRAILALAIIVFSVYLAEKIGLIRLVAAGFRYGGALFIAIMLLPLLTRGVSLLLQKNPSGGKVRPGVQDAP